MEEVNVLIVGSGPAGYTAALYASRANLSPILYKGPEPGGQLTLTSDVENYPGFVDGVQGPEMMLLFEKQAARFGADIRDGVVTSVDFSVYPFRLVVDEERGMHARTVIISTGARAKWLGLPSEQRLNGRGVSACAVCDGFFYKGKDVAVVGGGDTACEEAIYLANLCRRVHLLVRRGAMRASSIMQRRVQSRANIEILWNTTTQEVLGAEKVEGVRVCREADTWEIPIEGFFVAIGHEPNTHLFAGDLEMNENGYLRTLPGTSKTNIPGIFAVGDVQDAVYRQAVTAAGSGCMGALDAERFLATREG